MEGAALEDASATLAALEAELTRRYRNGEARVDDLLIGYPE